MPAHFDVQASGAMFEVLSPPGWAFRFGIFVADHDGLPVQGLQKDHFSVWLLSPSFSDVDFDLMWELLAELPSSAMPGIYVIQTTASLALEAPAPQQFVFAIRASDGSGPPSVEGLTTVAITYLGQASGKQ